MENLEQRRAEHAIHCAKGCRKTKEEGDCLSGYPALIINNGLLACLAFSLEKEGQHSRVADAIAYHLHELEVCKCIGGGSADARWLLSHLSRPETSAHALRRASNETLAFLGYLKRFVKTSLATDKP